MSLCLRHARHALTSLLPALFGVVGTLGICAAPTSTAHASSAEVVPLYLPAAGTCDAVISQPTALGINTPAAAVQAITRSKPLAAFQVASSKVKVTENGAVVDLSLRKGHSFKELSDCEQTMVLVSIRTTLRANAHWKIRNVVFTERGSLLAV